MRLLEFQGKSILRRAGIPVPEAALRRAGSLLSSASLPPQGPLVIKAQVPMSDRARAGGIQFAQDFAEAERCAAGLLQSQLGGFDVQAVLIEARVAAVREYFAAFTYDESARRPLALLSASGGSGVEGRAVLVERRHFSASHGLPQYQAREMALSIGVRGRSVVSLSHWMARLADLFLDLDMLLLEINPLAETADGQWSALDCRIELDDDAQFRHPDLVDAHAPDGSAGRGPSDFERRAAEIDATDHRGVAGRLIAFDGDLGLLIGGGGASLTIFDAVLAGGGRPANYCEIGGNPSVWKVAELTRLILSQPGVSHLAVIMNVVSNTRADLVARGVVKGVLALGHSPRERILAFRVPGSWQAESHKILEHYGVRYFDHRTSLDRVVEHVLASRVPHGHAG